MRALKFTFEGTAKEFNIATMEEVLLRQVQNRGRDKGIIYIGCSLIMAIGVYDLVKGDWKRFAFMAAIALLLLFFQNRSKKSAGTAQDTIKRIKEAIAAQTEEESQRIFAYTFEGNACTMSSGDEMLGKWEWTTLDRVSEADTVIALWRRDSKVHKSVLPVPKNCLKDATMDEFRAYLNAQLDKEEKVTYYEIPDYLRKLLD